MERSGDSGSQTPNYTPTGSPNSLQQSAPFPFCHKTLFQCDPVKSSSSAPVTPQCHCPAVSSHSYSAFLPLSLPPWAVWGRAEHSPAAFRPRDPSTGPASPHFSPVSQEETFCWSLAVSSGPVPQHWQGRSRLTQLPVPCCSCGHTPKAAGQADLAHWLPIKPSWLLSHRYL